MLAHKSVKGQTSVKTISGRPMYKTMSDCMTVHFDGSIRCRRQRFPGTFFAGIACLQTPLPI